MGGATPIAPRGPTAAPERGPRLRRLTGWRAFIVGVLVAVATGLSACNPFAPALEEGSAFGDLLGDPATVEGFFTNFRNAYELRDLSLYEPLLDSQFVFVWRDYDAQIDREWGFAEDLETTRRLFANAGLIRLQWSQILSQDELKPKIQTRIIRSFNLTITLESGDVFRGDGNVNFTLARRDSTRAWKLVRWRDESEF